MNKAIAIDLLKMVAPIKALTKQEYADFIGAMNMTIKALESEPCMDIISRQAVVDALWEVLCEYKALYEYEGQDGKQFTESDNLDVEDWILYRIFVRNKCY